MERANPVVGQVFREWQSDEMLLGRAARGFMANIGKKKSLNRAEVAHNKNLLAPVIRHMGLRPSLATIMEAVEMYLHFARCRGRPLPTREMVKLEAWIIKRLVYIFARLAKRGHRPRQEALRELMVIAGLPVPERSPHRSSGSASGSGGTSDAPDSGANDDENAGEDDVGEGYDEEEEEEECDEGDANCEESHGDDVGMDDGDDVGMDDGEMENAEDDPEISPTELENSEPETHQEMVEPVGHGSAPTEGGPSSSTPSGTAAPEGEIERGPHLRPGHYTVKSKKHGFECLRCGMKGYIRDIMETTCSNPHGAPKYYDEDTEDNNAETGGSSSDETLLKDELMALQLLEEEMQLLEAIEAEQAILDDLSLQCAALAEEEETKEKKQAITKRMVDDLVIMGFSQDMAMCAVQESKGEWNRAVELAHQKIREEEHAKSEKHEEGVTKNAALSRRKPATPCNSTSMPPPPVPPKKGKKVKPSATTPDTPAPAPVCTDQTDTLPTDTAEMEQLALSFALEDSPGVPEGEEGDCQNLLHKKTLRLGETDSDDEDDLPETHGSLETKKTLDYTELSKKVTTSLEETNPRPADVLASCGKPMAPTEQRGNFKVDQVDDEDEDGATDLGRAKKGRGKGRGRGRGKGRGRGRGRPTSKKESKRCCSDSEELHDPEASGSSTAPPKKKKLSAGTTRNDTESKPAKGETSKRSKSGKDVDKADKPSSKEKPPKSKSVSKPKPEEGGMKRKSKSLDTSEEGLGSDPDAKPLTRHTRKAAPKSVGKPKAKATSSKPRKSPKKGRQSTEPDPKAQKRSRKSSAYHVARKKALKEGKTEEEAIKIGKEAYASTE